MDTQFVILQWTENCFNNFVTTRTNSHYSKTLSKNTGPTKSYKRRDIIMGKQKATYGINLLINKEAKSNTYTSIATFHFLPAEILLFHPVYHLISFLSIIMRNYLFLM